ncbi:hypothetical protein [Curtobacterium sp. MCJR17_043]|uniref:hypothetical protein n=1 Tax=Curtobacterium sp. MCJR17_043 TaxID=2175660 RepID=UPI0024DF71DF|nr:hypothetical protein [Curtobacterium sp. MCJR17_043]WIB36072.1 hypothetical protein DEJ15_02005 [Curtobacterium sp. MCJR17_043]
MGSVETLARRIDSVARSNHLSRFDLKYDLPGIPREARERSIRLLGEQVAPRVRELLTERPDDWHVLGRPPATIAIIQQRSRLAP